MLGSTISLLVTDFSNTPVIILLGIFSFIFGCLTGIFAYNSLNQRNKARDNSTRRVKYSSSGEFSHSISTTDAIYIGQLYKMMYSMQIHIFKNEEQIVEESFKVLWEENVFPGEEALKLFEKFIDIGLLIKTLNKDDQIVIEYNYDFVPEIFNKRRRKKKGTQE